MGAPPGRGGARGALGTVEQGAHVPMQLQYSSTTASAVLAAIVGATAALTGFMVTVTTLVMPMATGRFSARYMPL